MTNSHDSMDITIIAKKKKKETGGRKEGTWCSMLHSALRDILRMTRGTLSPNWLM